MIQTLKESDEVLYPEQDIIAITSSDLDELKRMALLNTRQRIRLCTHSSPHDRLHEMFIVHTRECYVRPHRHLDKVESLAILEGEADMVLFEDDGTVRDVLPMGDLQSGKLFYHRLAHPVYHTLLIRSDFLVFHECTEGPFLRKKTAFPEWAPIDQTPEVERFIEQLEIEIRNEKADLNGK